MDRESIQERFGIIGTSPALRTVIDQIRLVARTEANVLINGESGVGKELVAQAIHGISIRKHKPLIIVNCGAIPEGLIESELFGNEKGAYTGATERRAGYFESADGGTIFLDEIGEMPQPAQVRLLRVLESGQFSRVGSSNLIHSDVRVVAATNKDLAEEVKKGRFREDLYYRLSTIVIRVPALRERQGDILPIFLHFLHQYVQRYNAGRKLLDDGAKTLLQTYRWPGNIRELRNVAEQTVVMLPRAEVSAQDLKSFLRGVSAGSGTGDMVRVPAGGATEADLGGARSSGPSTEIIYRALVELRMDMRQIKEQLAALTGSGYVGDAGTGFPTAAPAGISSTERGAYTPMLPSNPARALPPGSTAARSGYEEASFEFDQADGGPEAEDRMPTLEDAEKELISDALKRYDGNRRQAARALGISERTLYRKIKDFDIT